MNKVLFLDRDGTIIKEVGYLKDENEICLLPNVPEALRAFKKAGFLLIIISNQAGIARGYFTIEKLNKISSTLNKILLENKVKIDGEYYCPHHPEGVVAPFNVECDCRKPKTQLIDNAVKDFNIDLNESILIGDKAIDIETAINAKIKRFVLVKTGYGKEEIKKVKSKKNLIEADDLKHAAEILLK